MKRIAIFLLPLIVFAVGCKPPTPAASGPDATTSSPAPPARPTTSASAGSPSDTAPVGVASATPPTAQESAGLAASSNAFGTDLYARLRKQPGNLAFSPGSITLALAMTWAGARGDTATEMSRVLHFSGSQTELVNSAAHQLSTWKDPSRTTYTLHVANRLFGEKSYSFDPSFIKLTGEAFQAPLEPMDFRGAPEPGRQRINGWVASETKDRIKDLIPLRAIDSDTRLVLVNALYFLGDWASPFGRERTRKLPFFVTPGGSKDVPMMNQVASFKFAASDGVKVLEMPYRGNELAMTFVLPDDKGGLDALEQQLTADRLGAWIAALKNERVQVTLPIFEIEPDAPLSLGKTLQEMGMKLAFDSQRADFTGIASPPSPANRLVIGAVFHKAFVKVNEKGTEAAAATAVVMPRGAKLNTAPANEFRADHPFLFFLRDTRSGMILFMGRVSEPKG